MAETSIRKHRRSLMVRHRGRVGQIGIFLGKQLRMFVYQNDWKVLPMAALIAGLVGMVIRNRLFDSMEGTLMGSFALVCVAIWNGCFNSIQVICRERDVIKRQHRSGMHISSYIVSHMIYQLLLCLLQTGITMYITRAVGVKYDLGKPLFTQWFIVDFGIAILLITYASDMMSLWISCLAHTTTTAMTIMPFVLIFQLVFSGGMLSLPAWTRPLTLLTISNPGLKTMCTQADYNSLKVKTLWNTLSKMRDREVGGSVTVGQVLDILSDRENPALAPLREKVIDGTFTLGQLQNWLESSETFRKFRETRVLEDLTLRDALTAISRVEDLRNVDFGIPGISVGKLMDDLLASRDSGELLDQKLTQQTTVGDLMDAVKASGVLDQYQDMVLGSKMTLGEVFDWIAANPELQARRDQTLTFKTTLGKLFAIVGEDNLRDKIETLAGQAGYNPDYEYSMDKVLDYWFSLLGFALAFAALSVITLEFIDKDKR